MEIRDDDGYEEILAKPKSREFHEMKNSCFGFVNDPRAIAIWFQACNLKKIDTLSQDRYIGTDVNTQYVHGETDLIDKDLALKLHVSNLKEHCKTIHSDQYTNKQLLKHCIDNPYRKPTIKHSVQETDLTEKIEETNYILDNNELLFFHLTVARPGQDIVMGDSMNFTKVDIDIKAGSVNHLPVKLENKICLESLKQHLLFTSSILDKTPREIIRNNF